MRSAPPSEPESNAKASSKLARGLWNTPSSIPRLLSSLRPQPLPQSLRFSSTALLQTP